MKDIDGIYNWFHFVEKVKYIKRFYECEDYKMFVKEGGDPYKTMFISS